LQADYLLESGRRYGIEFSQLYTLANMPITHFRSMLVSKGEFHRYMSLLRRSHREENLANVICRKLISVDYRGYVYDCDFNQNLGIPLRINNTPRTHLRDLMGRDLGDNPIMVADHCDECTAGQGSSCGGALS
jgi:radical SAM/Cys-rich protein